MMKSQEPDAVQRAILLTVNSLGLLALLYRVITHWNALPWAPRIWGAGLTVVFALLWRDLIREKSSLLILIGVSGVLLGALGLAVRAL